MTYRSGDSPEIDDREITNLTGRFTRMGGFDKQVFSLHYAGWDDWWIVRNIETGHDMGRCTGTEIMDSGLLIPTL